MSKWRQVSAIIMLSIYSVGLVPAQVFYDSGRDATLRRMETVLYEEFHKAAFDTEKEFFFVVGGGVMEEALVYWEQDEVFAKEDEEILSLEEAKSRLEEAYENFYLSHGVNAPLARSAQEARGDFLTQLRRELKALAEETESVGEFTEKADKVFSYLAENCVLWWKKDVSIEDFSGESIFRKALSASDHWENEIREELTSLYSAELALFAAPKIYDTQSLRNEALEGSATAIASQIAEETKAETTASLEQLFSRLETDPSVKGIDDLSSSWSEDFIAALEEVNTKWDRAQTQLLQQRFEWENTAEDLYRQGEEEWQRAYDLLWREREEWQTLTEEKISASLTLWQGEERRLLEELSASLTETRNFWESEVAEVKNLLETSRQSYEKSREMAEASVNALETWWKIEFSAEVNFFEGHISSQEAFEKVRAEFQKVFEEKSKKFSRAKKDEVREEFNSHLERIAFYFEKSDEFLNKILTATDEYLEANDFPDELDLRIGELEEKLHYFQKEQSVATAVAEYAQNTGSGRETAEETVKNLQGAREKYEEVLSQSKSLREQIEKQKQICLQEENLVTNLLETFQSTARELEEASKKYDEALLALEVGDNKILTGFLESKIEELLQTHGERKENSKKYIAASEENHVINDNLSRISILRNLLAEKADLTEKAERLARQAEKSGSERFNLDQDLIPEGYEDLAEKLKAAMEADSTSDASLVQGDGTVPSDDSVANLANAEELAEMLLSYLSCLYVDKITACDATIAFITTGETGLIPDFDAEISSDNGQYNEARYGEYGKFADFIQSVEVGANLTAIDEGIKENYRQYNRDVMADVQNEELKKVLDFIESEEDFSTVEDVADFLATLSVSSEKLGAKTQTALALYQKAFIENFAAQNLHLFSEEAFSASQDGVFDLSQELTLLKESGDEAFSEKWREFCLLNATNAIFSAMNSALMAHPHNWISRSQSLLTSAEIDFNGLENRLQENYLEALENLRHSESPLNSSQISWDLTDEFLNNLEDELRKDLEANTAKLNEFGGKSEEYGSINTEILVAIHGILPELEKTSGSAEEKQAQYNAAKDLYSAALKEHEKALDAYNNARQRLFDETYARYDALVAEENAQFRVLEEAKTHLDIAQGIYDWATGIYLEAGGSSLTYESPVERQIRATNSVKKTETALSVLRKLRETRQQANKDMAVEFENYKKAYETSYASSALSAVLLGEISAREERVKTAHAEAELALAQLVKPAEVFPYESPSVDYARYYMTDKTIFESEEAFNAYFSEKTVATQVVDEEFLCTSGEADAKKWLEEIFSDGGDEKLNRLAIAAFYVEISKNLTDLSVRQIQKTDANGVAYFEEEKYFKCPEGASAILGNYDLDNFHNVNINNRFTRKYVEVLEGTYADVISTQEGRDNLGKFFLFKDTVLENLRLSEKGELCVNQWALSETADYVSEKYNHHKDLGTGFMISGAGLTAAALAASLIPPLALSLAASATAMFTAGGVELFKADALKPAVNFLIAKENGQATQIANLNGGGKYSLWQEKHAAFTAENQLLQLYYGITDDELTYETFLATTEEILKNSQLYGNTEVTSALLQQTFSRQAFTESGAAQAGGTILAMKTLCQFLQNKELDVTLALEEKITQMAVKSAEAATIFDENLLAALSLDEISESRLKIAAKNISDADVSQEIRENAQLSLDEIGDDLYGEAELSQLKSLLTATAQASFGTWDQKGFFVSLRDLHSQVAGKYTARGKATEDYASKEINAHLTASHSLLDLAANQHISAYGDEAEAKLEAFYADFEVAEKAIKQVLLAGEQQWLRWENTFNEEYARWRRDFHRNYDEEQSRWDDKVATFAEERKIWTDTQYANALGGIFTTDENPDEKISALLKNDGSAFPESTVTGEEIAKEILRDGTFSLGEVTFVGPTATFVSSGKNQFGGRKFSAKEESALLTERILSDSAKFAALRAEEIIRSREKEILNNLDLYNAEMLAAEKDLAYDGGYTVDNEGIRRLAVVDSTLATGAIEEVQTVHLYENFRVDKTLSDEIIRDGLLHTGDAAAIQTMIFAALNELENFSEDIFGENGAFERHVGVAGELDYGGNPQRGDNKADFIKNKGSGQVGKYSIDFAWNDLMHSLGVTESGKAIHDVRIWDDTGSPIKAPSMRKVVEMATSVALGLVPGSGQILSLFSPAISDLLFASQDLLGGYKSIGEVAGNLGKKLAVSALSLGTGQLAKPLTALETSLGGLKGQLASAGISGAVNAANHAAASFVNNINFEGLGTSQWMNWDGLNKSLGTFGGWAGVVGGTALNFTKPVLGSLQNNKLLSAGMGLTEKAALEAMRFGGHVLDANGDVEAAWENMGGITLNLADLGAALDLIATADVNSNSTGQMNTALLANAQNLLGTGLFELNISSGGVTGTLGSGGINLGYDIYNLGKRTVQGIQVEAYAAAHGSEKGDAVRHAYYYGDATQEALATRLASGKDTLSFVHDDSFTAKTTSFGTGRHIQMNSSGDALSNAIVLGHEAYRDGLFTNSADNYRETLTSILAHSAMATRMEADGINLNADALLQKEMDAYRKGELFTLAMIAGTEYDSSEDFWKLYKQENGVYGLEFDGYHSLRSSDGKIIVENKLDEAMRKSDRHYLARPLDYYDDTFYASLGMLLGTFTDYMDDAQAFFTDYNEYKRNVDHGDFGAMMEISKAILAHHKMGNPINANPYLMTMMDIRQGKNVYLSEKAGVIFFALRNEKGEWVDTMTLPSTGQTHYAMVENMVPQGRRLKAATIKYDPESGLDIFGCCSTMPDPNNMEKHGALVDGTYDFAYSVHLNGSFSSRALRLFDKPIERDGTIPVASDYTGPITGEKTLERVKAVAPDFYERLLGKNWFWDRDRKDFDAYKYNESGEKVDITTNMINSHPSNKTPYEASPSGNFGGSEGCLLFTPSNEKRFFRGLSYNPNRAKSGTITVFRSPFGDGTGGVNNYSVEQLY